MKNGDIWFMNEESADDYQKNSSAVIAGVMTAILAGLLLLLIIRPFSFIEGDRNTLMFHLSFFGWFFFPSLAGGFICTTLSANRDIIHVLICALIMLTLIYFLTSEMPLPSLTIKSLLILAGIPLGNLAGAGIGIRFKRKKSSNKPGP